VGERKIFPFGVNYYLSKLKKKNILPPVEFWLVVEPTPLKNMLVKMDHETPGKDEHSKNI